MENYQQTTDSTESMTRLIQIINSCTSHITSTNLASFMKIGPDVMGSGKAVLRPQKDFTRPGLKRRIGQKVEDGTPRKAGAKPDGGEIKQKGASSGYLEQIKSVKEEPGEPKINSFIEVDDAIKKEVDDHSPPTSIVPYLEMEKYVTIDMPTL